MEFDTHVTSKIAKSWQHICYKSFIVVSFFITEKVCHHHHKWKPCSPFLVVHLSGKFLIRHKCLSLWSIKNTSLDLLEGQTREHRKCFGSIHGQYSTPWQTVSSSPAWYGAKEISSFLDWKLDCWQIWHTCLQSLTYGPLLLVPMLFSSSVVPHAKIAGVLCRYSLLT